MDPLVPVLLRAHYITDELLNTELEHHVLEYAVDVAVFKEFWQELGNILFELREVRLVDWSERALV